MDPEALELLRRGSGLSVDVEGRFRFRGERVPNPRVQALFHRGLAVRDDGALTLTVGPHWCYVECAKVARFVCGVRDDGGALVCRLITGDERRDLAAVACGPDDRIYLWFDGLFGPALALRAAHQGLLSRVVETPSDEGGLGLLINPITPPIPLVVLESVPLPAAASPRAREGVIIT